MSNGDVITIHNPLITVPEYTIGNNETPEQVIPAQQLVSFGLNTGVPLEVNMHSPPVPAALPKRNQDDSGMLSAGIHPLSGSYRLGIANVLTSKKALVYLIDGFRASAYVGGTTPGGWGVQVNQDVPEYLEDNGTMESSLPIVGAVTPTSNFTCSFTIPYIIQETEQSQSFAEITLADIPGLVEGAHEGIGLGDKFLRHIERCKSLVHLIDITDDKILENYLKIRKELAKYSNNLLKKKEIIIFNKIDIIDNDEIKKKLQFLKKKIKKNTYKISVIQNKGLNTIKKLLINNVYRKV